MSQIRERIANYTYAKQGMSMGVYPYFRAIQSEQGPVVTMNGRPIVMMGSNNYLGLTNHPEVKEAAKAAIDKYGTGCAGSRFLNGTLDIHLECERAIADYLHTESALVFSTGYMSNMGTIAPLSSRDCTILLDRLDHASIIDSTRLGFGRTIKFRHNDMEDLEEKLRMVETKLKMIVIDGIFSMEGDIADLPEIVRLAEKYNADVIVDDAHAVGVLGKMGRGTAHHFGVQDRILGTVGTFSKSLASIGGFFAGPEDVIHYLKHNARVLIFTASPPPSSMGAVIQAIKIIKREPERIDRLWQLTDYLFENLRQAGFRMGTCKSPIIPVYVGDDITVCKACLMLQDEGVFVNPVLSPAVPPEHSLIRLSLMSTHTEAHIDFAVEKLIKVGKQLGFLGREPRSSDAQDVVVVNKA